MHAGVLQPGAMACDCRRANHGHARQAAAACGWRWPTVTVPAPSRGPAARAAFRRCRVVRLCRVPRLVCPPKRKFQRSTHFSPGTSYFVDSVRLAPACALPLSGHTRTPAHAARPYASTQSTWLGSAASTGLRSTSCLAATRLKTRTLYIFIGWPHHVVVGGGHRRRKQIPLRRPASTAPR